MPYIEPMGGHTFISNLAHYCSLQNSVSCNDEPRLRRSNTHSSPFSYAKTSSNTHSKSMTSSSTHNKSLLGCRASASQTSTKVTESPWFAPYFNHYHSAVPVKERVLVLQEGHPRVHGDAHDEVGGHEQQLRQPEPQRHERLVGVGTRQQTCHNSSN